MQLEEKVALITGAVSGLGKAAALLLAREGAKVAALDLAGDELDETAGQIRGRGGEQLSRSLGEPRPGRAIGVVYLPATERRSHYSEARLSRQFDAVIHLDVTSALTPLK